MKEPLAHLAMQLSAFKCQIVFVYETVLITEKINFLYLLNQVHLSPYSHYFFEYSEWSISKENIRIEISNAV